MSRAPIFSLRTALASLCLGGLLTAGSALLPETASAQRMQPCATEGGTCRLPYPAEVVYGAKGRMTSRFIDGPSVRCSNRVFGDPAPGVRKSCYIVLRGRGRDRDYGDGGWGDGGWNNGGGWDNGGGGWGDGGYGEPRRNRWVACASENDYCDFNGRKRVRYGVPGNFEEGVFRDGVECSNDVFGDPAPGARKRCYVQN
ncbi:MULTISPECIES: hypothetical protein [Hyphomicrobiales]|uniref:hypothetical protein n=1 Tax=Hyphomicrobiales TaxID=356 RepID=UPI00035E8456|nr:MULTISPECIES: hypothetical protein [Phyllobacteriaceae]MCX8572878.1 hypothetical protein [Aminobacter sp. MET-1]